MCTDAVTDAAEIVPFVWIWQIFGTDRDFGTVAEMSFLDDELVVLCSRREFHFFPLLVGIIKSYGQTFVIRIGSTDTDGLWKAANIG